MTTSNDAVVLATLAEEASVAFTTLTDTLGVTRQTFKRWRDTGNYSMYARIAMIDMIDTLQALIESKQLPAPGESKFEQYFVGGQKFMREFKARNG